MSKPWSGHTLCKIVVCLAIATMIFGTRIWLPASSAFPAAFAQGTEPTPTVDPLDVPELPENPTQVDVGRVCYYYNCMPCHGDKGQGLTEEWRMIWVEDHQNCWDRGCHGGRPGDEGFPLPETISAIIGPTASLGRFPSAKDLYQFLVDTHPPQRPGALPEEEYWALTAFLLAENGRLPAGTDIGPVGDRTGLYLTLILALTLGLLAAGLAIMIYRRRRRLKHQFSKIR